MIKGILGVLMVAILAVVAGCDASGGGVSSGSAPGDGYSVNLTATQTDMPTSAENSHSTQSVIAVVLGTDRTFVPDGTPVTFTCSAGSFLVSSGDGELTPVGTVTVETSNGRASVVYAAPTSPATARIQASASGAYAWVDVNVYSGL